MINLYHIEGRRSERVAWLLEEVGGLDYELDYVPGDILGSLLKLEQTHETRMTPIIKDGDVVMIESGAILEYLLARYAQGSTLRPREDSPEFPRYLQFLHYAEGTAMARLVVEAFLRGPMKSAGIDSPLPKLPGVAGSRTESERVMYFVENVLAQSRYFAGENFTAADIMMHFPLKMGAALATKNEVKMSDMYRTDNAYLDQFPNVKRFLVDMHARPAFQRAIERCIPNGPPAM
ncbi:MAG: glutathione binding-like protein [Candidatus Binatus sp.]|jgi:glutathione S-transferase